MLDFQLHKWYGCFFPQGRYFEKHFVVQNYVCNRTRFRVKLKDTIAANSKICAAKIYNFYKKHSFIIFFPKHRKELKIKDEKQQKENILQ